MKQERDGHIVDMGNFQGRPPWVQMSASELLGLLNLPRTYYGFSSILLVCLIKGITIRRQFNSKSADSAWAELLQLWHMAPSDQ